MSEVPFEQLDRVDRLVVDTVYKGGTRGNAADDPISKLVGCGNQGGFRIVGRGGRTYLVVLYTSLSDPDWPDFLDVVSGSFVYYGDNKSHGSELHSKRGNRLLRYVFNEMHAGNRENVPPFFVFTKGEQGRDVVFRGLAAPGSPDVSPALDLVAVWKSRGGHRFQNYRAVLTTLDTAEIPRRWLEELRRGEPLGPSCPRVWRDWVLEGRYASLRATRTLEYRSREEQLPSDRPGQQVVQRIYEHFSGCPHEFERCAVEIARFMDQNIAEYEITRRSADGGRDATGKYRIGKTENAITVDFLLEAKLFAPSNPVGVRHTSRLVSRLRNRQFGILVTTSYVSEQAYKEVKEDGHPVVFICARDIVNILRDRGLTTPEAVGQWLEKNFPLAGRQCEGVRVRS